MGFGMGLGFGLSLWIDSFSYSLISVICQEAGFHGTELIHDVDAGTVDVDTGELIPGPSMLIATRE